MRPETQGMTTDKRQRTANMRHGLPSSFLLLPSSFLLLAFSFLFLLPGCRRTDVREMTVSLPALQEVDKAKVVEALARYSGIEKDSYRWDTAAKTLTLRYDSMQVAQANIRYAIDAKGVKVAFPEKTDDRAGH